MQIAIPRTLKNYSLSKTLFTKQNLGTLFFLSEIYCYPFVIVSAIFPPRYIFLLLETESFFFLSLCGGPFLPGDKNPLGGYNRLRNLVWDFRYFCSLWSCRG